MPLRSALLLTAVGLAAASLSSAAEPAQTPLSVEAAVNALQFAAFAPIALSPDGELIAYTIQDPRRMVTDGDERYRSYDRRGNSLFGVGCDIWLTDTRNGGTRKLTEGKGSHYYPVWSPDGRSLAFYSDRDGAARLWIWDRGGNRFRRASDRIIRPLGGQTARWSPDGKRILFPVLPEGMSIEQAADLAASEKPAAARPSPDAPTVTVFDGAEGKGAGTGWSLKAMVEDIVSVDVASGAIRSLTHGLHPFWFQFSPDGATVAISSLDSYGAGTVFQPTYDFLAVDAATGASRVLVAGVPSAAGNQASFSPDGKSIAYCAGGDAPEAKRGDCLSVPIAGGAPRLLTPGAHPPFWSYAYREPRWEPSGSAVYLFAEGELWKAAADGSGARPLAKLPGAKIIEIVSPGGQRGGFWSPDGRSLTLLARDEATKRVSAYRVDRASGSVTPLFQADAYFDDYTPSLYWDVSRDGSKLVYVSQDSRRPEDLWIAGPDWKDPRQLTHVNPGIDTAGMGATRLVDWRALDGEILRGALLLPAGYEEGRRYPTIVYPYGGSGRSKSLFEFGLSGTGTENMQLFASRGYAVFLPDTKARPGTPMRDISDSVLSGVSKLIELGVADPERLGIMGHSYGGYSTLSVIVQSRMFRAAVARSGLFNLSGAYGDLGLQGSALNVQWAEGGQGNMGGSPWQYRSRYIENSPWFYLDRVETPLLIIHGAADQRVPVHNADQLFVALRRLGKTVMYARYDGEDHSELYWGYRNRLDYCRRVIAWFDEHLKKPEEQPEGSPVASPKAAASGSEHLLPGSANDWEPALAVGPGGSVYITAGRRRGSPRDKSAEFSQQIVIWSSHDDGATFEGPFPVSAEGQVAADQRVAVDDRGTVYVSYLGYENQKSSLQLARSKDGGRTFAVRTVTDKSVSDKPELAVSPDGKRISIVYESGPGPTLISSHDGGETWDGGKVVEPARGRHFWPMGLAFGAKGDVWFAVPSMDDAELQKGLPTPVTLNVFRSSDLGETWRRSDFGDSPRILGGCAHDPECRVKVGSIGVAADDRGRAYVAYTEGKARQPYTLFFKSSTDGGRTWTAARKLSLAARPKSGDEADRDFVHVAAHGNGHVCVVWVDDRLGAKNVWARCSLDAGRSWSDETLLSNRTDGAPYKGAEGFDQFYGHYGGIGFASSGRLHAAWPEGPRGKEEGAVWVNFLVLPSARQR